MSYTIVWMYSMIKYEKNVYDITMKSISEFQVNGMKLSWCAIRGYFNYLSFDPDIHVKDAKTMELKRKDKWEKTIRQESENIKKNEKK